MALSDGPHLSPDLIATYLAREASVDERSAVQQHLLTCRSCRQDMAAAVEFGVDRRPRRWKVIAIPAAAAAAALLLILGQGLGTDGGGTDGPVLRGGPGEGVRQFAAVAPAEQAAVSIDSLVFVWRSDGGSETHYRLTLTDENGDVVWTAGTSDTSLTIPRSVGLEPETRYYWYVDALLEGARSSTTGVLEFSVTP